MKTVTLSDLQQRSGAVDVSRLKTGAQGKPFMLRVRDGGLEYVPESTGKARPDTWAQIERVLGRFNKGGSLKPADYHDITRNSSYFIATLLHLFPRLTGQVIRLRHPRQRACSGKRLLYSHPTPSRIRGLVR